MVENGKQTITKIFILIEKLAILLPEEYSDFANIFSKTNTDIFLKYSIHNLAIEIEKEKVLLFGPVYNYLGVELHILRDYINKILAKSLIILFRFFFRALILFMKKKDDSLHWYVDYWGFNAITIKINIFYHWYKSC